MMNISIKETDHLRNFRLPEYSEIPDVGLYLKQVVKYINDSAGQNLGFTVTDSMLSNYVKMHMIPAPVKKQYYREHIALLLFISMAKSVLSLENIDYLLKLQQETCDVSSAYAFYKVRFENALSGTNPPAEDGLSELQSFLGKVVIAMSYKFYLDACFVKETD